MSAERRIFVMRHGERVDFTFNDWLVECFDKQGNYFRRDLNLPKRLPKRKEGFRGFAYDSPLTVMGTVQAFLVGEAMRDNDISFDQVYCSPSLRCVQTCHHVLKGLGALSVPINIEPGELRNLNVILQSGDVMIFVSVRFYVKSIVGFLEAQKLQILPF